MSRGLGDVYKRQEEGATLFMTLLAGYQTLLHYYSGQNDIVVGTDDANRQRGETEGLIGFFINQLALRSDFSGRPSFRQLLRQVRQTTLDAFVNRDVPFEKVVEALQVERTLQYTPLFQAKIDFQNTPRQEFNLSGLSTEPFYTGQSGAKTDLAAFFYEVGEYLSCSFNYDAAIFNHETMQRYSETFRRILRIVAHNPEITLDQLLAGATGSPVTSPTRAADLRTLRPTSVSLAVNVTDGI